MNFLEDRPAWESLPNATLCSAAVISRFFGADWFALTPTVDWVERPACAEPQALYCTHERHPCHGAGAREVHPLCLFCSANPQPAKSQPACILPPQASRILALLSATESCLPVPTVPTVPMDTPSPSPKDLHQASFPPIFPFPPGGQPSQQSLEPTSPHGRIAFSFAVSWGFLGGRFSSGTPMGGA